MNKQLTIGIVAILLVQVLGFVWLGNGTKQFGGTTNFNDLSVDTITATTSTITGATFSGAVAITGTLAVGSSGTTINKYLCGTTSFEPGTINSITVASTSVSVAGAAAGDVVLVSSNTVTSTHAFALSGKVRAAGVVQVTVFPTASSSLTMTTSTFKACVLN